MFLPLTPNDIYESSITSRKGAPLVNVNIQFKKGVPELCVLVLISRRDRYGYELAQAVSRYIEVAERGFISTASPSGIKRILHNLFTGID
jgi:hypothetical protein